MYSGRAFSHGFPCLSQSSASSTYNESGQGRDKELYILLHAAAGVLEQDI